MYWSVIIGQSALLTRTQLTAIEQRLLIGVGDDEGIRRFYWIWVMKEAYTKALGLGLGFDFRRIEYNVPEETVRVDGKLAEGWEFFKFEVADSTGDYLVATAEYVGGTISKPVQKAPSGFYECFDADVLARKVLKLLE